MAQHKQQNAIWRTKDGRSLAPRTARIVANEEMVEGLMSVRCGCLPRPRNIEAIKKWEEVLVKLMRTSLGQWKVRLLAL